MGRWEVDCRSAVIHSFDLNICSLITRVSQLCASVASQVGNSSVARNQSEGWAIRPTSHEATVARNFLPGADKNRTAFSHSSLFRATFDLLEATKECGR